MNKESLRDILEKNQTSTYGWALYCWICDGKEAGEVLDSSYARRLKKGRRTQKRRDSPPQPVSGWQGFEGRINGREKRAEILKILGRCCL